MILIKDKYDTVHVFSNVEFVLEDDGSDDKQRIAEDEEKVSEIKKHIAEVIEFMDANK